MPILFPAKRTWVTSALALSAIAITACTSTSTETATNPGYDKAALRQDLNTITDLGVTGVQARFVTENGKEVVATSGFANIKTKEPVPSNGYSRVASSTKPLTATVVLQLVGEGKLALDDSVEKHLPGVVKGGKDENKHDATKITVRHLLQNTSGIVDNIPGFDTKEQYLQHRFDAYTHEQFIQQSLEQGAAYPLGKGWAYSNTNFLLAEKIIEKVTGKPWQEVLQTRILNPLGMKDSIWPGQNTTLPTPHARAYSRYPDSSELVDTTELLDNSGNLISTTRDMNKFYRALMGGKLLRPQELAEMKKTVKITHEMVSKIWPGGEYGLGIVARPLDCGDGPATVYWSHGGGETGYISSDGVTDDGKRSIAISQSSALPEKYLEQEKAASKVVHNALCG